MEGNAVSCKHCSQPCQGHCQPVKRNFAEEMNTFTSLASNDNLNMHLDRLMLSCTNQGECRRSQVLQLSLPRDTTRIGIIGVTEKVATTNAKALEPWARATLGLRPIQHQEMMAECKCEHGWSTCDALGRVGEGTSFICMVVVVVVLRVHGRHAAKRIRKD